MISTQTKVSSWPIHSSVAYEIVRQHLLPRRRGISAVFDILVVRRSVTATFLFVDRGVIQLFNSQRLWSQKSDCVTCETKGGRVITCRAQVEPR